MSTSNNLFTPSLTKLSTSLQSHPPPIHQACILTVLRVIDNILSDPTNVKLRKIKVSNPAFWKRAGQWDGCIDFLVSCGFRSVGGKNGVPGHLKYEGKGEMLICGREELVRFAVENLGLQKNLLPVCPVKTEWKGDVHVDSKGNSSETASLPVETSNDDQQQAVNEKIVETPDQAKPQHSADSTSNEGLNKRATKTESIAKSSSTSSNSIECSSVSSEILPSTDVDANSEPTAAGVPQIQPLSGDNDLNTTIKEPIKANDTAINTKTGAVSGPIVVKEEYVVSDHVVSESSTKNDAANSHALKSDDEAVPEGDTTYAPIPVTKSKDEATTPSPSQSLIEDPNDLQYAVSEDKKNNTPGDNAIEFSADHRIGPSLMHDQVTTQAVPAAAAVSDEMTDLLEEIENELNDYTNTDPPISANETVTDSALVKEAKDANFSSSSAETNPDADDNAKSASTRIQTTTNDDDGSDRYSMHAPDLSSKSEVTVLDPEQGDDIIAPVGPKVSPHDNSQNATTTSSVEEVNSDGELDYNKMVMGLYLADSEQIPLMNTCDSKEDTSSDRTDNSKPTNSVIESKVNPSTDQLSTPQPSIGESETKPNEGQLLSDDSETVLSLNNVPMVDQFTNEQVEALSIDDTKAIETECSSPSADKANISAKSTSNAYQLSARDIPLPECEYTDDVEIKVFHLGFELCHRMLISLWSIEDSLHKATQTSMPPTDITTGLANVKTWTKFSNEDDLNLHTESNRKGDDSHCIDSKPALIVPLAFVYKAWAHILRKDATTRSRTMYSWIVSNHPNLAILNDIPAVTSILFSDFSETDLSICNYVCNSLRNCGLITVYGADVIAFSDDLSSDLSFFVGIGQTVLNGCTKEVDKSLQLDESLFNECHDILANALKPHLNALLEKEDLSLDESTLLWHSCRYVIHHLLSCGQVEEAERLLLDKKFAAARLKSMGYLRSVYTLCWDCASMTALNARFSFQQQLAGDILPSEIIPDWRQNCTTSLCSMSAMLQDHISNNCIDISTRSMKAELGTCFHMLGESIGNTHNIAEAIKQYEEALNYRTEAFGDSQNHESIADTLYALGCCYQRCRSHSLAQKYYEQSLKIYKRTIGYNHPSIAKVLHNIGIMYASQSNYDVAMKCLKKSLAIRKMSLGENHITVADSLCWIGNIHRERKELYQARDCFIDAHEIKVAMFGYSHPESSEILQNLGIVCFDLEMYSKSLSYYKEAMLSRRANIQGPNDIQGLSDLCESLHSIANVYKVTGQFERALQFHEQVLKRRSLIDGIVLKQKLPDKIQVNKLIQVYQDLVAVAKFISRDKSTGNIDETKFSQVGSYLVEIGKLYEHRLSKPMKALLYYQEAMDAFKEANNHTQIISCLTLMGSIHVHASANEKALSCFSKALVMTLQKGSHVPRQSLCHADLLHNIGNCHAKKGDYKKCVISYRDSLKIKKKLLTLTDLSTAKTEHCLALALLQLGDSNEALKYFRTSLKAREEKLGVEHLDVGFSLHHIGKIYLQQGNIDESINYLERALGIKKIKMKDPTLSLAETEHVLASGYLKKERYFDAISLLECSVSAYKQSKDCDLLRSDALDLLGHASSVTGDLVRALTTYEESLRIKQTILGFDHIACGNVLMEIGKLQLSLSRLEEALATFKEVKRLHKIHYVKDNLKNADLLIQVGTIQYRRNKLDVALKCFMEALRIRRLLMEEGANEIAHVLIHLGRTYQAMEDHTAAISCFQQALDIKHDDDYEVRRLIGTSHLRCDNFDDAVSFLEACLRFQETTKGNGSDEWISIAFDLATAKLKSSGNRDDAFLLIEQTIFLAKQNEIIDERLADALFQYGELETSRAEALTHFEECLAIRKQMNGDPIKTSDVLFEIGLIHESNKQYRATLESYQESLKLRQSADAQDERTADILFRLGEVHRLSGKLDLAFNNLTVALGAYYMSVGKNHVSVANTFHSLGHVCDSKNDTIGALKNHKMGIAVRRLNLGNDHPDVASSLDDLARLYQKLGDNVKALECLKEGLRIRRLQSNDNMEIATNLFAMGIVFAANEDNKKARECYDASLEISSRHGNDPKLEAQTLHQVGCLLASNCQYKEALQKWRTSLSKYREAGLSDDSHIVACTLGNIEMAENVLHDQPIS